MTKAIWMRFSQKKSEVDKTPILSGSEAVAQHLEFVKQAFTNWLKPEVVLKSPDTVFEKTRPQQILNEILWAWKSLPMKMTKTNIIIIFDFLTYQYDSVQILCLL